MYQHTCVARFSDAPAFLPASNNGMFARETVLQRHKRRRANIPLQTNTDAHQRQREDVGGLGRNVDYRPAVVGSQITATFEQPVGQGGRKEKNFPKNGTLTTNSTIFRRLVLEEWDIKKSVFYLFISEEWYSKNGTLKKKSVLFFH